MSSTYPTLFEACAPRDDVLDGSLQEEQFAAKLSTVVHNPENAAPVYRDPGSFYDMTYPTEGLRTLLSNLAGRFLATTDYGSDTYTSSILCLDTRFGGGKTHDLIAAYHLAEDPSAIDNLQRFLLSADADLAAQYGEAAANGLDVATGVFIGTKADSKDARHASDDPNAPNTRTMWGELAYQLYGLEGYEFLKDYDQDRDAPGEGTLTELFDQHDQPALILIDEIADYMNKAAGTAVGNQTLADQTLSFVMALLEAATETDNVTVVYSIADTAFGEQADKVRDGVRDHIEEVNEIGRRQHKTVTPTDESEIGQVLQHRLFEEIPEKRAHEAAESYFQFYDQGDRQYPQEATDASYVDVLEREYPFHPSLIDALTDKIDTIPRFQRTRDALRLLARAVYYLWNNQPEHYDRHWIRIYDLTVSDDDPGGGIQTILRERLFDFVDLGPAVTADIYDDDGTAHAQLEDRKWTENGIPPLGTHLTTTVLWHSLAYGEQAAGLTHADLNLALGHPHLNFDDYDAALSALRGDDMDVACYYLYEEERIRFKQEPNLIRIIDQRIDSTPEATAHARFENQLINDEIGDGGFESVEFPESPADLPDTPDVPKIAVMHPDTAAVDDGGDTPLGKVEQLYTQKAAKHDGETETRVFKNYALFLAPDADRMESAIEEARRLEAIEALLDSPEQKADLSTEQIEELRERSDEAQLMLAELVRNVYRHLYYPDRDGLNHITISATESNGGTTLVEAVQTTLEDKIVKRDAGARGSAHVDQRLWQQTQDAMSTEALVNQYAKKPGLDYLFSTKPIRETVASLVSDHGYAYWDADSETAYWTGDDPEGWPPQPDFDDSPDVETTIRDSDVKIGPSFHVYQDIDSLLEDHLDEIERPESPEATCAECGTVIDEPEGSTPYYCEEHQSSTTCSSCGTEVANERLLDGQGRCQDCQPDESWDAGTKMMSASRAFSEVRRDAESTAGADRTPLLAELTIEVGSDDPFQAAKFISQRPGFKAREDAVTARMEYETRTNDGTYTAEFTGSPDRFRDVIDQPGSFGDTRSTIQFRFQFDEPEPITDARDDLLAALDNDLDSGSIDVRVEGEGPIRASSEVTV
ncbi:DUF499 domain-containing protein [Halorhabdus rudnickae]|uniref:DUF499 domain-containing protein n=1 Tax=Halorhabdus rudnickae TaxID=1775544 RepID=UPI001AEF43A4|nr:DUF499 domain-containing protein [Halorhabdus rudnickae]